MLRILATIAIVVGSVRAVPHSQLDHDQHLKLLPYGTNPPKFPGTGIPIVTGTGLPIFNLSGYSTITRTLTSHVTFYESAIPTAAADSSESTPAAPADKHKAQSQSQSAANACAGQGQTVTVTVANTVTVTVEAEADAEAATSSPAQAKNDEHVSPSSSAHVAASAPAASHQSTTGQTANNGGGTTGDQEAKTVPSSSSSAAAAAASQPAGSGQTTNDNNTTTTANPPANQGGLPFKTKRGIIGTGSALGGIAHAFGTGKVSWLGNWYSGPPKELSPALTFVPQMYGRGSVEMAGWKSNADKAVKAGEKYFLSFGEPETTTDNKYMDPNQAAQLWMEQMEPYAKQGITIGAPGTLQGTSDFTWLRSFIDACDACTIGFIAMHWFDKAGDQQVKEIKEDLMLSKAIADKKGVPVWLDNFSAGGTVDAQKSFLSQIVPWLDEQDWIHAYAYVPPELGADSAGKEMVLNNALTPFGEFYANL